MKTQSCKSKGRKLQQTVRDVLLSIFPTLQKDDIASRAMGSQGTDLALSPAAQLKVPYAIECKNQEAVGPIYKMWEQALDNATETLKPMLVIKKNHQPPLVVLSLGEFADLLRLADNGKKL